MKKFKLLKDLPLAKAGTIVTFIAKPNGCMIMSEDRKIEFAYIYLNHFQEWLEEIEEKPKSIWDLGRDDNFYYIKNDYFTKANVNDFPFGFFEGDAFLTEEEAKKELAKRKAIQRIKKFCWENGIELADREYIRNVNNFKYFIIFNFHSNKFIINFFISIFEYNFIFFKNEDDAQKVIDNCEADLRIIFDV